MPHHLMRKALHRIPCNFFWDDSLKPKHLIQGEPPLPRCHIVASLPAPRRGEAWRFLHLPLPVRCGTIQVDDDVVLVWAIVGSSNLLHTCGETVLIGLGVMWRCFDILLALRFEELRNWNAVVVRDWLRPNKITHLCAMDSNQIQPGPVLRQVVIVGIEDGPVHLVAVFFKFFSTCFQIFWNFGIVANPGTSSRIMTFGCWTFT